MVTIYHNPRCRKSREGLEILEKSGVEFKVVPYLKEPLDANKLKELLGYLGKSPIELIRTNEEVWKSTYKGKNLTDEALVDAMVTHPKLIERPIVVKGSQAVIGRPAENILALLEG